MADESPVMAAGEPERPAVIARGDGILGEIALRRRGSIYELIVNGVFVMDSAETSTEELLAQTVLERHEQPRRVLVGGLGLGFTTAALLRDPRVERVDVVEIEPLLVGWLRDGLVPDAADVLADPRVHIRVTDVHDALTGAVPAYEAVLLDVDNGPGFLVHDRNAWVYRRTGIERAARALIPSGLLALWSSQPSGELHTALYEVCGRCEEVSVQVEREGRRLPYYIYVAVRTA